MTATPPAAPTDPVTLSCVIRDGRPTVVVDTPGHPLNRLVVRCADTLKRPGAQYHARVKPRAAGVVDLHGGFGAAQLLPSTLPARYVWEGPVPEHSRRGVLRDGEGVARAVTEGDMPLAMVAPYVRDLLTQRNARQATPGQDDWSATMRRGLDVTPFDLYPHEPHPTDDLGLPVPVIRHRRDLENAERFIVEGPPGEPRCHHETCAAAFAQDAVTARGGWAWAAASTETRAWALWRQALNLPASP